MKLHSALPLLSFALAACQPDSASPNMSALDACKRADVKDRILDEISAAFASKSGGLIAMFGGPEVFSAISEDFKTRATIENPRISDTPLSDQRVYEVHCTVDLATVNSADDDTPVEFRNVEFTIHYNNGTTDLGTEDYYLIPKKVTFFRTVYVNGMPKEQFEARQQAAQNFDQPHSLELKADQGANFTEEQMIAAAEGEADAAALAASAAADAAEGALMDAEAAARAAAEAICLRCLIFHSSSLGRFGFLVRKSSSS